VATDRRRNNICINKAHWLVCIMDTYINKVCNVYIIIMYTQSLSAFFGYRSWEYFSWPVLLLYVLNRSRHWSVVLPKWNWRDSLNTKKYGFPGSIIVSLRVSSTVQSRSPSDVLQPSSQITVTVEMVSLWSVLRHVSNTRLP